MLLEKKEIKNFKTEFLFSNHISHIIEEKKTKNFIWW